MKKALVLLMSALVFLPVSCDKQGKSAKSYAIDSSVAPELKLPVEAPSLLLTWSQESLLASNVDFSLKIMGFMPEDGNYVISPLGIQYVTGMLGNVLCTEEDKQNIQEAVFPDAAGWGEINNLNAEVMTALPALDLSSTVSTANFLYITKI